MDSEIIRTIDRRRKRTPKELDYEDLILLRGTAANALEVDANGPMIFVEYIDRNRNALRYLDPRTRIYGKATVANVKALMV